MKDKFYKAYYEGAKMPRKLKKKAFGIRIKAYKLKIMLRETIAGTPITTMYERREFTPYGAFCPKCGFKYYRGSGNMTTYPEHWEKFRCLKCNNVVGYIDNSPFVHALECPPDYNPVF